VSQHFFRFFLLYDSDDINRVSRKNPTTFASNKNFVVIERFSKSGHFYVLNTGKLLPVSVFGVPNTGIPVSVYTGLETLVVSVKKAQRNFLAC
jgi:hypothetical protein